MTSNPRLYTSKEWLEAAEYVHLLWPHWGASHWEPRYEALYADFMSNGRGLFSLTEDPSEADYFLPPCGWQHKGSPQALRMAEFAARYGKPLLLFFHHDSNEMIPVDDSAWILRTSMYLSKRRANEEAWPAWSCDLLRTYGNGSVVERELADRPVVGYCGYVDYRNTFERLHRMARGGFSEGAVLRGRAVRTLSASSAIDARFILRRCFGGHSGTKEREEYARNLLDCDYALVARGNGNFSFRLYEAMSAAAIPVFIDTDCCLPFDDVIPYRELFVWVPASDVRGIADHVARFHAAHDALSLHAHRLRVREVYDRYLEPLAFHRELASRMARRLTRGVTAHG